VKWEGSSSTAVRGIIVITKAAINDKEFLEWIANRDLYEIWEKRKKPKPRQKTTLQPKSQLKPPKKDATKDLLDMACDKLQPKRQL
jgi:hypothetical protein